MEGLQRALMYDGGTLSAPNTSDQETHPADKVPVCNWEFSGSSVVDKFAVLRREPRGVRRNPEGLKDVISESNLSVLQRKLTYQDDE